MPTQAAPGVGELALRPPAAKGTPAPVALALLQAKPTRSAALEADSTVRIKRDVQQAQNVSSQAVSLPGFADAFLTSYDEPGPGGDLLRTENVVGDLARADCSF